MTWLHGHLRTHTRTLLLVTGNRSMLWRTSASMTKHDRWIEEAPTLSISHSPSFALLVLSHCTLRLGYEETKSVPGGWG